MRLACHHIGLSVSSMERSLDFFAGALGFPIMMQREITTPWVAKANGIPPVELKVAFLDAGGQTIELLEFQRDAAQPAPTPLNQPGAIHLALLVEDIDRAVAELRERGVPSVSDPQTNMEGPNEGSRIVFVYGPDNVRVELVQPPPGRPQYPLRASGGESA